ncbi:MAG: hypothetical protein IJZ49_07930 [Alistipes sp.]|nr:hypothetical protein [Alistipes sp.]
MRRAGSGEQCAGVENGKERKERNRELVKKGAQPRIDGVFESADANQAERLLS